jgi:Phytanoyl-CoA dioxygenase (PhyH)
MTSWSSPNDVELERGLDPSHALAAGDALEAEGRLLEAVDALGTANRLRRDTEIERRLVRLRHEAFARLDRSRSPGPWPPRVRDEFPGTSGPPVVSPDALTLPVLRSGILQHGCLLIRGLVPQPRVDRLVEGIDRALEACDRHAAGAPSSETTPWFEPFAPGPGYSVGVKRKWVRDSGGVLTGDSPRVLNDLIETLEEVGLGQLIRAHLDERPVLSMNKCTLRRVPPEASNGTDWHQDGAFLGDGIRTVNVWLSLSHCGQDAPGLDIVPRRLDGIVETGTEGAIFPWAVAPAMVERVSAEAPVCRPIFEPGDALLFDDVLLHRTAGDPEMTRERYAIETWFFAPSTYPGKQIPLVF